MATLPDPESLALNILSIFVDKYNCRPGEVLQINAFLSAWPKLGYPMSDFNVGVEVALKGGWLETVDRGLRITEVGFLKVGRLPTPEESARAVLSIFVDHFKVRPDGALQVKNLNLVGQTKRRLKTDDIVSGIQFSIENGWIEELPGGMSLRLTEAGFTEA